nr:932_t:CDS:2 [Entrophospora candida]
MNHGPTLVIHGGAGVLLRENLSIEERQKYLIALEESLKAGNELLKNGGKAIDVVEAAVRVMEDCPLFNAGKESSIMVGTMDHPAGASTLLHTVKNPITLAKTLLLDADNPHVFLGGVEAENYAKVNGLELVDPKYFWTEKRWKQHLEGLEKKKKGGKDDDCYSLAPGFDSSPMGTVGAVAVDKYGTIATATSTGGFNNKKDGRIGDTPLIACGTWADNETCGVSGTGNGEVIAQDVSSRMKYLKESVEEAAFNVVENLRKVNGAGGVIALDKYGNVAMPFNSTGMYRGYIRANEGIPYTYDY